MKQKDNFLACFIKVMIITLLIIASGVLAVIFISGAAQKIIFALCIPLLELIIAILTMSACRNMSDDLESNNKENKNIEENTQK